MRSHWILSLALLSSTALPLSLGCAAEEEEVADGEDAALSHAAEQLEAEIALLGGSRADLVKLVGLLDARIAGLDAQKKASKDQAKADVASYTNEQWDRSFFHRDELELAEEARADDIFDRPERRALEGAKMQKRLVEELIALVDENKSGSVSEPTARASYIREGYVEIAVSIALNNELGLMKQGGARLGHILRKKMPWLGKIFRGLRRDRRSEGIEGEAVNIDRNAPLADLWKKDPATSTVWHPRKPEEITPARLYRGPWFSDSELPHLPNANETWKLVGLRSQKSDGAHPAVDIAFGDAGVKLKFKPSSREIVEEGPHARLLWAMGYETDPQYTFDAVRVEPRAFVAAFTSINRIGIRFGSKADEIIPGRPPKGFSFAIFRMSSAPGGQYLTVRYADGHEDTGDAAVDSLERAKDDRPLLDSMESVLITRAYGEVDHPTGRDGIGPWEFDAENHVDDREVRAVGIIMVSWLGSNDQKFNNVRLDTQRPKNGPVSYGHTLSDVGGIQKELPWTVDIDLNGRVLHSDTNTYTVDAFDRLTMNDAKWAVARIAALTEEQIVACVASGALTDKALAVHAEKLISRRDSLVKTFGLTDTFPLLRPNGANQNPPPRSYRP